MRVIGALWLRNVRLFMRNRVQLVLILVMPFFYLYLLSTAFKYAEVSNPYTYVLAGIVIIVVFQTSLNIATNTIDDIVSGYMKEILVSPVKRIQIAIGQILSSTTIAVFQGVLILIAGLFIGLTYTSILTPLAILGTMLLTGLAFSSLGLFMAAAVRNAQTFQVLTVAVTTPITFLCGVYIPLALLPAGLQAFSLLNPMTYAAAFFRAVSLEKLSLPAEQLVSEQLAFKVGSFIITPGYSALIVCLFGLVFLLLSTSFFSRADFTRMSRSGSKDIFQQ